MKYGIRDICDVVFKAKKAGHIGNYYYSVGQPVLYIDSAKTSTIEGAATTVYATGGRGNSRLIAWEGEKTLTFTVEDALLSDKSFAMLSGAGLMHHKIKNGSNIPVHKNEQVRFNLEETSLVSKTTDGEIGNGTETYQPQVSSNIRFTFFNGGFVNMVIANKVTLQVEFLDGSTQQYKSNWEIDEDVPDDYGENIVIDLKEVKQLTILGENFLPGEVNQRFRIEECVSGMKGIYYVNQTTDPLVEFNPNAPYDYYIICLSPNGKFIAPIKQCQLEDVSGETFITFDTVNANLQDLKSVDAIVDFYTTAKPAVNELIIDANNFADNYYVEAKTSFRRQYDGKDLDTVITYPNAKIQSNFTFNMAATGDPSTFTFTMDAMPGTTINNPSKKVLCEMFIVDNNQIEKTAEKEDSIQDVDVLKIGDTFVGLRIRPVSSRTGSEGAGIREIGLSNGQTLFLGMLDGKLTNAWYADSAARYGSYVVTDGSFVCHEGEYKDAAGEEDLYLETDTTITSIPADMTLYI